MSEYNCPQTTRKDIYAYINQLVHMMKPVWESQPQIKRLMQECKLNIRLSHFYLIGEPNWTALRKAVEDEEEHVAGNWGDRALPDNSQHKIERKEDVIRKHEEQSTGLSITDKGAASTTKKIVQSSVQSRKKMMMFDDALK